jgi:hypothetical protein
VAPVVITSSTTMTFLPLTLAARVGGTLKAPATFLRRWSAESPTWLCVSRARESTMQSTGTGEPADAVREHVLCLASLRSCKTSSALHHQLFIREIEAFLKSDDEVLLLFAPPGSAKSTYVSVLLPSWYLAANPTHSILAAIHNVEFAERWGRRVRNDIAADAHVLGISLSENSKAATRWSLISGGEYYSVGAGMGISGFRANLGVGDEALGKMLTAAGCLSRLNASSLKAG